MTDWLGWQWQEWRGKKGGLFVGKTKQLTEMLDGWMDGWIVAILFDQFCPLSCFLSVPRSVTLVYLMSIHIIIVSSNHSMVPFKMVIGSNQPRFLFY